MVTGMGGCWCCCGETDAQLGLLQKQSRPLPTAPQPALAWPAHLHAHCVGCGAQGAPRLLRDILGAKHNLVCCPGARHLTQPNGELLLHREHNVGNVHIDGLIQPLLQVRGVAHVPQAGADGTRGGHQLQREGGRGGAQVG
jgi:hypothetical protein